MNVITFIWEQLTFAWEQLASFMSVITFVWEQLVSSAENGYFNKLSGPDWIWFSIGDKIFLVLFYHLVIIGFPMFIVHGIFAENNHPKLARIYPWVYFIIILGIVLM